jgi:hypothetical protein
MAVSEKLKKKLAKRQEALKKRGGNGALPYFIFKEGKTRMRLLNVGGDIEPAVEVTTFWLGKDLGTVISPVSFGGKCAIFNRQEKLAQSKKESEKELAKQLKPKKRFIALGIRYKDDKGKEVDEEAGMKPILLSNGQYNDIISYFLDDEQGDMTDPKGGYDIKFERTGKGQMDTEYSTLPCRPTPCPKKYKGPYDLEEEVKKIMPSYEDTKEILAKFLNSEPEESEDERPAKKSLKKKRKSDM